MITVPIHEGEARGRVVCHSRPFTKRHAGERVWNQAITIHICMYVYKYSVHILYILCVGLGGVFVCGECYKLIGLLFLFCLPSSLFCF